MLKKRVVGPDGKVLGEVEGEDLQELLRKGRQLHEAKSGPHEISAEALMFSHAQQFHGVVNDTYPKENTAEAFYKITAYSVNAAFALEVYFKLLLRLTLDKNAKAKGHSLKILYNNLANNTKAELENRFSDHIKERWPDTTDSTSAEDTCSRFDKAFVKWRYRYERPLDALHLPIDHVALLLNVLAIYCFDLLNKK